MCGTLHNNPHGAAPRAGAEEAGVEARVGEEPRPGPEELAPGPQAEQVECTGQRQSARSMPAHFMPRYLNCLGDEHVIPPSLAVYLAVIGLGVASGAGASKAEPSNIPHAAATRE